LVVAVCGGGGAVDLCESFGCLGDVDAEVGGVEEGLDYAVLEVGVWVKADYFLRAVEEGGLGDGFHVFVCGEWCFFVA
jgi:hypothetical protein